MLKNNYQFANRKITHNPFNLISETFDDGSNSLDKVFTNYLQQGQVIRSNSVDDVDFDNPLRYDTDPLDRTTKFEMAERLNVDINNNVTLSQHLSNENERLRSIKVNEVASATDMPTDTTDNA